MLGNMTGYSFHIVFDSRCCIRYSMMFGHKEQIDKQFCRLKCTGTTDLHTKRNTLIYVWVCGRCDFLLSTCIGEFATHGETRILALTGKIDSRACREPNRVWYGRMYAILHRLVRVFKLLPPHFHMSLRGGSISQKEDLKIVIYHISWVRSRLYEQPIWYNVPPISHMYHKGIWITIHIGKESGSV